MNPRLFVDQIVYIINHAEDRFIFFDSTFVDLVNQLTATSVRRSRSWIYLGDATEAATRRNPRPARLTNSLMAGPI